MSEELELAPLELAPEESTKGSTPLGERLSEQKFLMLKNLLPQQTCQILSSRIQTLKKDENMLKCEQCPTSHWVYDDPFFVEVQQLLRKVLSAKLGLNLLISFSSVRYYPRGETLKKHLDREAAELVLSVTIDYQGNQEWPLFLQRTGPNANQNKLPIGIGDAVLFSGSQLYHWREPLENEWQIQAFFFFVDAAGPFKDHAGDIINKYKDRS